MSDRKSVPTGTVLIVDDAPESVRVLSHMLAAEGHQVQMATNGPQALESVQANPPDLILLDILMPEMDGFELCARLQESRQSSEIPIIFISALDTTADKVNAFAAGGVDYVSKPFRVKEVIARVETHLALQQMRRELRAKNRQLEQEIMAHQQTAAQRVQAEWAVVRGQEEWARTFDAVPDLIMLLDDEHRIIRANRAMAEKLGISPQEAVGLTCCEWVHELQTPPEFCPHCLLLADGQKHTAEVYEERLDGTYVVTVSPLYDANGQVTASVHIAHDITARKTVEEALARERRAVQTIAEAAIYAEDASDLCHRILSGLVEIFGFDFGIIWLFDEQEELLRPVTTAGLDETASELIKPHPLDDTDSVAASVASSRQPILTADMSLHPKAHTHAAWLAKWKARSHVSWPILGTRHALLGVIQLVARKPQAIAEQDTSFYGAVAEMFAAALERKRIDAQRVAALEALRENEDRYRNLFAESQRQAVELALLNQVRTALVGGLDLTDVFSAVVEAIAKEFGYTLVSLYLLEGDDLVLQHQVGYGQVLDRIPASQGVMGRVARTGKPVLLKDVHADDAFLGAIEGIVSEVCVPLSDQGRVVGTLNIESTQGMPLSKEDLRLMMALSEQINMAIGRARLHMEIQESEERFRQLVENASDLIYRCDANGHFVFLNPVAVKRVGYSEDELLGKHYLDLIGPDFRQLVEVFYNRQFARKISTTYKELPIITKDSEELWIGQNVEVVMDGGRVMGFQAVARDITQRKRAEEQSQKDAAQRDAAIIALRENEQRYRALFERTNDAVFILDLDGTHLAVNRQAADLLGYTEDELVGMKVKQVVVPREYPHSQARMEDLLAGRTIPVYERIFRRKDGTEVPVEINVAMVYDPAGEPLHIQSIVRDISARKRAEAEMERLLTTLERRGAQLYTAAQVARAATSILDPVELIRQAVELVREQFDLYYAGLFLVDRDGEWTGEPDRWLVLRAGTGPAGQKMLAQRHKMEIGGASMVGQCVVDQRPRIAQNVGEETVRFENPHLPETRSEAALPLASHGEVIGVMTIQSDREGAFSRDDMAALETMVDQLANAIANARLFSLAQQELAERVRVEEALRKHAVELQARNEDLDAFARSVAHDLKNPLGLVVGYVEVLREDVSSLSREAMREYLDEVVRAARKIGTITDELLLLARVRREDVAIGSLGMAHIVDEVLQRLDRMIQKNKVEMVVTVPQAWPAALGYAPWVEEVWINYVSNGIKYGGRPPRVELGATPQADGMIQFWVQDNGRGLTPDEQDQLFKPFSQLGGGREGTQGYGLGLSIVRRIVEKLGGQVGVESQAVAGQGSRFWFSLPAADEAR